MATEALEGKVTVVTGAAVGMGTATARVFGEAGAKVLVADVDEEKGGQTAEAITAAGGTASFLRVDVSRAADVEAMVATAVERYGRLDCAVDNAAVTPDTRLLAELDEAEFAPVLSLLGRFGRPEEVAQASLWLCSEQASFVTGAALAVDAGYSSR